MAEKDKSAATREETELRKKKLRMLLDKHTGKDVKDIKFLYFLEDLKAEKHVDFGTQNTVLPDNLKCPSNISFEKEIYWPYIQQWLSKDTLGCSLSEAVIPHTILSPHCLTRKLLSRHVKKNNTEFEETYMELLLHEMKSSLSDQKSAATELVQLTKKKHFGAAFCRLKNAFRTLLSPLAEGKIEDPVLQDDLITTVFNLSIQDSNKKLIAENPDVIPLLGQSMKFGTMKTKRKAAAVLSQLSHPPNRIFVGNSYAPVSLLEMLCEGPPLVMKEAASAIFNLCIVSQNIAKFIEIGAVNAIVQKIKGGIDCIALDKLLSILKQLSKHHQNAIDELWERDSLHCVLQIIRDSSSEDTKEICVTILFNVSLKNPISLRVIEELDAEEDTLADFADTATETEEARWKATYIVSKIIL